MSMAEEINREGDKALSFLEREGYRRCDIAACNCGSWHKWRDGDPAIKVSRVVEMLKGLHARTYYEPAEIRAIEVDEIDALIRQLEQAE